VRTIVSALAREQNTREAIQGLVFDIDTFAVHDGPGIRLAVYLKGCPLSCAWCHSPESQSYEPELVLTRDRCLLCGRCVVLCAQAAHAIEDGHHAIARERCLACGRCAATCPGRALAIKGYRISAGEVMAQAARMKPFFDHSGGGITLSGGEVAAQAEFAAAVLAGCREQGIHTAIETCGAASWDRLRRLVELSDLVLYDIKLVDEAVHRRWVGASNRQILDNARRLAGYNVQVRVPLIPGITDTAENLDAILGLMREAGLGSIALLPYNTSAGAKYEWLDRDYGIEAETQSQQALEGMVERARAAGLVAVIG
jgi:pyruvate formate lyase activating enzyme